MQEIGETRDAILEDLAKRVEDIINANQHVKSKYWIVIFAKSTKYHVDGKPMLAQHIKPYKTKPMSMVGQIVVEVDNEKGTVSWEVNMPDVPFEYNAVPGNKYIPGGEVVHETTTIGRAYA